MNRSIYDSETLRALREQVRRFVDQEVIPHGERWERDGMVRDARIASIGGGATEVMLDEVAKRM